MAMTITSGSRSGATNIFSCPIAMSHAEKIVRRLPLLRDIESAMEEARAAIGENGGAA